MTAAVLTRSAIRTATEVDEPRVLEMACAFLRLTPFGLDLHEDPDTLAPFVHRVITGDNSTVIVACRDERVVGMIALWLFPHPMSNELMASDLAWWMDPEQRTGTLGARLVREAERWATARGAVVMQMVAPVDAPRVARFYGVLGYHPVETSYLRRL